MGPRDVSLFRGRLLGCDFLGLMRVDDYLRGSGALGFQSEDGVGIVYLMGDVSVCMEGS